MTLHTYDNIEQRSDAWYQLRCGIVTSSVVGKLISARRPAATEYRCNDCGADVGDPCVSKARTKGTPAPIKTAHPARTAAAEADNARVLEVADDDNSRAVTATLVAERLAGFADEYPTVGGDMWRGVELEPVARDAYIKHHYEATEVGLMICREADWSLGYSPDGLVGEDGLIEVKAPRGKGQVLAVLNNEVPARDMAQVQAGLLVSGRKWLDYIPYTGGLPLWVKRVYPDPAWQDVIVAACRQFETTANQMVTDYRTRTEGLPATERFDPMNVELKL